MVKTGGLLVKHACYYWLLLVESHLTRQLFASMVLVDCGVGVASRVGAWPAGRCQIGDESGWRRMGISRNT
jgi:hypothetical protein